MNIWIQIHDLPVGFMFEAVGKQLEKIFGEFLKYDPKNSNSIWWEYMTIRIRIDVSRSLKRKKKINRKDCPEFVVSCKYERLGDFCFYCGMLTHTERFCQKKLEVKEPTNVRDWGSWLRSAPRTITAQGKSKWLR